MRLSLESKFKQILLAKLNRVHKGWENGDEISEKGKKSTDLINKDLKIAIEIKDDKRDYNNPKLRFGFDTIRNQLKSYAQGARRKFRNYPNYKTILLVRSLLWDRMGSGLINFIFPGNQEISEIGKNFLRLGKHKNKYFSIKNIDIGGYIFYGKNKIYYLENPIAQRSRILNIKKVQKFFTNVRIIPLPQKMF